jgi:hypothetical protein
MGGIWRSEKAVAVLAAVVWSVDAAIAGRIAQAQQDTAAIETPDSHFEVEHPADLLPDVAERVYRSVRAEMAAGYAQARQPKLRSYLSWRRFNNAPYRSATHGARYVNNYANAIGQAYGAFEQAGILPVGSILLKDSFTATADGGIFPGPMFVMEKMEAGFNPQGGDWRYAMIMPDGSLFGETKGVNTESVEFCIGCHAMRKQHDHLFFIPDEFRTKPATVSR